MAEILRETFCPVLDSLERVHYGDLMRWGRLSVLPLLGPDQSELILKTLESAYRDEDVVISELAAAKVSEINVLNRSDELIFGMDGEELIGAKQNRILNLSVVFPANSESTIPVSCIEEGRWGGAGRFRVGRMHNARARARRQIKVSQSIKFSGSAYSDQGEVWRDVRSKQASMSFSSNSRDLSKVYEENKNPLDRYKDRFPLQEDQIGGFFFLEGIVGLELFSDHKTFRALYPKILDAHAIEAMEDRRGPQNVSGMPEEMEKQLKSIDWDRSHVVGAGDHWRYESKNISATAVVLEDSCIHLSSHISI